MNVNRGLKRKLLHLHDATDLRDRRAPPANRLESLKGDWKGFYSTSRQDEAALAHLPEVR